MKLSVKKAIIILLLFAVIGVIIVAVAVAKKENVVYVTSKVVKGKILQTVSETGSLKAINEIDLNFLNSGKLAKMNFEIGNKVKLGSVIAELDYRSLIIKREEAQANLDINNENLNKLLSGATVEDINVAKANVTQAKVSYESAQKDLEKTKESVDLSVSQAQKSYDDLIYENDASITISEQAVITAKTNLTNAKATYQRVIDNKIDSALSTAEDKLAVGNNALDVVYTTINDEDGEDYISVKNKDYLNEAERLRSSASSLYDKALIKLDSVKITKNKDEILVILNDITVVLNMVFDSLEQSFYALENSITAASFNQASLDALKAGITAQQTLIAVAISSVQSAEQNLDDAMLSYNTNVSVSEDSLTQAKASYNNAVLSAKNALATAKINGEKQIVSGQSRVDTAKETWEVAQAQLNKIIATPNKYDRSLAAARIRQAQATINNINKQIEDSIITAPISGTITNVNYDVGEQVSVAGGPVVSILGENNFEIEVLVSEADIAKINLKDKTEVTLDAFGDDVKFAGEVFFIEPAETVIQDVIYYKISVNFKPEEKSVKSGMTANVIITTDEKNNVLITPSRSIIDRNGDGKFVRILEGNEMKEKLVKVGLRGDGGMTEIISGLSENEVIVTSVKEK